MKYNHHKVDVNKNNATIFKSPVMLLNNILSCCGYGKYLYIGCNTAEIITPMRNYGINIHELDTSKTTSIDITDHIIIDNYLELLPKEKISIVLKDIYQKTKNSLYIIINNIQTKCLTFEKRDWWEQQLLKAGFRKHPNYYFAVSYESLNNDSEQIIILVEKIPNKNKHTLDNNDSILHDDMLLRFDRRSDGHCYRYVKAAAYIKSSDVVLDMACGLGYGSHILYHNSLAKQIIGIDICDESVAYANENYANNSVRFFQDDAETLLKVEDNSIDFIVSFETIEHLKNPKEYLKQLYRVLKPSGRVFLSAPNDWTDETGTDPNPYHFHVYTRNKLFEECSEFFLVEKEFGETAGGALKCHFDDRSWRELDVNNRVEVNDEWILLLGMKTPIKAENIDYIENSWKIPSDDQFNFLAFQRDYINPWLLKSMVLIGRRVNNNKVLLNLQQHVIEHYESSSVDYGAALCGYIYNILHKPISLIEYQEIKKNVDSYCNITNPSPHQLRWQLSLTYVFAELSQNLGDVDTAYLYYENCIMFDPLVFSVTLGNKTIDALFKLAIFDIQKNNIDIAKNRLLQSIQIIKNWYSQNIWINAIGDAEYPLGVGLSEMSQILDKGARASYLLDALNLSRIDIGICYRESYGYYGRIINDLEIQLELKNEYIERLAKDKRNLLLKINELSSEIIEQNNLAQDQANKVKILDFRNYELAQQIIEQSNLAQDQANKVKELDLRTQELAKEVIEESNLANFQANKVKELDLRTQELAKEVIEQSNLAQDLASKVRELDSRNQELAKKIIEQVKSDE